MCLNNAALFLHGLCITRSSSHYRPPRSFILASISFSHDYCIAALSQQNACTEYDDTTKHTVENYNNCLNPRWCKKVHTPNENFCHLLLLLFSKSKKNTEIN